MDQNKLLIVAAVGIGGYLYLQSQAKRAQTVAQVQASQRSGGSSVFPSSPAGLIDSRSAQQAYWGLGQMIGGIFGKVYGPTGVASGGAAGVSAAQFTGLPDDAIAATPTAAMGDPAAFEAAQWAS